MYTPLAKRIRSVYSCLLEILNLLLSTSNLSLCVFKLCNIVV